MIKYKLVCKDCNTKFDSWFASSNEYERLKKRKFLSCNSCNSLKVEKTLMAPRLINSKTNSETKLITEKHKKIKNFDIALNNVLLNLAKRVVADGEGASKFVSINVAKCKNEIDAKKIAFSIGNSPLVKTAIAGEDPNWGRIIMAIGKAGPKINLKKLCIKLGNLKIVQDGKLYENYSEDMASKYMKKENIEISIEVYTGKKDFTAYTMDLTKEYIDINSDYRS